MASRGNPNPTGSKPDKLMRDALMVALKREAKDAEGQKTTKLALIADKLVDLAAAGDVQAIKEVADRVDGRPAQAIVGPDGGSIFEDFAALVPKLTDEQLDIIDRAQRLLAGLAAENPSTPGDRATTH